MTTPRATIRDLAAILARDLAGRVCELPTLDRSELVVVLPDARMPILVSQHVHTIGMCVTGAKAWNDPASKYDAARVREVVAVATSWAAGHPDEVTLFEVALELAVALRDALGEPWFVGVPGTYDPRELWLHPRDRDVGSVGVADGHAVLWLDGELRSPAVGTRAELRDAVPEVIAVARAQQARYADHVARTARVRQLALRLADELTRRLGGACTASFDVQPSHARASTATLSHARREVATVASVGEAISIRAGLPGSSSWQREVDAIEPVLDEIVAAIRLAKRTLAIEDIKPGKRYRVLADLQGLRAGATVRFVGFDDIDNHYGCYEFVSDDGKPMNVSGDFSTPRHSPLGEAHRYLESLD